MTERRLAPTELEVRENTKGGKTLTGYAAVFNRYSQDLGGFVEQVLPGAFAKTIQENDIRGLHNHDKSLILGRNRSQTLRLAEDSTGLHYEVDLPKTTAARDLSELVERGDVTGSSFSFETVGPDGDDWSMTDQDYPLRSLLQVRLFDVGPVTYPAYLSTEENDVKVALRSLATHLDTDNFDDLLVAAESRSLTDFMKSTADDEARERPEQTSTDAESRLALARRRLEFEALL